MNVKLKKINVQLKIQKYTVYAFDLCFLLRWLTKRNLLLDSNQES